MLRLWGRTSSINVRKVIWTAQELDLAVQRTDAGGQFGLVREAEYLGHNPNGLVPLIEDEDGYRLWESNVIVRYLCARYAHGGLYPDDIKARFVAEQWMDWQQTTFNPAGRDAFIQLLRTPAEQRDDARIVQSVNATVPLLAMLEAHLAKNAYMTGEQFSMADIPIGCEIHRWFALPLQRPSMPHTERWFQSLVERTGARGVLDMQVS
ncbi:glutathione S-transferase [Diaphorobacter sp. HDW4A]|uniref:glutathione S-transferase n=1 Tax=Diaphorobacter sp. HDW4A TaxID=2714924 RepID=UPI001408E940|nr:glutathione S-transferase [Diaphorobacter sp. HDW4A]QIL83237.1 glutathione S-transferase [Diaphorobacter sp. HDW4A]